MSCLNESFLSTVFADLISQEFEEKVANLHDEYDVYFNNCDGSEHDYSIIHDEWLIRYNKLVKRRNWLWYLMKHNNFIELDDEFNTNFTFENLNLRLNV